MKLISLSDFLSEKIETGCAVEQIGKLRKYKDFLKQPLKLEMFVPCDQEGDVLEEPIDYKKMLNHNFYSSHKANNYKKAKEKVMFENIDQGDADHLCDQFETIEDMVDYSNEDFILTPSAIKKLGL